MRCRMAPRRVFCPTTPAARTHSVTAMRLEPLGLQFGVHLPGVARRLESLMETQRVDAFPLSARSQARVRCEHPPVGSGTCVRLHAHRTADILPEHASRADVNPRTTGLHAALHVAPIRIGPRQPIPAQPIPAEPIPARPIPTATRSEGARSAARCLVPEGCIEGIPRPWDPGADDVDAAQSVGDGARSRGEEAGSNLGSNRGTRQLGLSQRPASAGTRQEVRISWGQTRCSS